MYFCAVGEVYDQVHGGNSDAEVCKAVSQLGGAGDGHNEGSGPAHGRARDGEAATGHGDGLCRGGDGSHCPASPPQAYMFAKVIVPAAPLRPDTSGVIAPSETIVTQQLFFL